MQKQMGIDYFHVQMPPNCPRTFEDLIQEIAASPDDANRCVRIQGAYLKLIHATAWSHSIEGEIARIRMQDIPAKGKLAGPFEEFDLDNDEGMGEETAFIYSPALHVLVLQRNRSGVGRAAFGHYIETKGRIGDRIEIEPVIRSDVMRKLARMQVVKHFDIKLAGLSNQRIFTSQGHSVKKMVQLGEEFRAPVIKVSLSVGHRGGSLDTRAVKKIANELRTASSDDSLNQIRAIEVDGTGAEGEKLALDLLEFKLIDAAELDIADYRRVPYVDRRNALRHSFTERRAELASMHETPNSNG